MKRHGVFLSLLFLLFSQPSFATEAPSAELGRKLFESNKLGANGKSCATCHTNGNGLDEISGYDDATLKEMINFCIRDALKGKMLDPLSQELEAMLAHLRSMKGR